MKESIGFYCHGCLYFSRISELENDLQFICDFDHFLFLVFSQVSFRIRL